VCGSLVELALDERWQLCATTRVVTVTNPGSNEEVQLVALEMPNEGVFSSIFVLPERGWPSLPKHTGIANNSYVFGGKGFGNCKSAASLFVLTRE
jgi:hypothetical protein